MSEGVITDPKTKDGYGLIHIEARHGDQIRANGYKSVLDFIEDVAKNWSIIKEGKDRNGNQTYRLIAVDKHNNTLMIELSRDSSYWNINTAGIFKNSYGKNNKEIYNRHTTAKQSTETDGVSQGTEQSGTTGPSSMSTPISDVSGGKGSNFTSDKQGKGGESSAETAESDKQALEELQRDKVEAEAVKAEAEAELAEARKKAEQALAKVRKLLSLPNDASMGDIKEAYAKVTDEGTKKQLDKQDEKHAGAQAAIIAAEGKLKEAVASLAEANRQLAMTPDERKRERIVDELGEAIDYYTGDYLLDGDRYHDERFDALSSEQAAELEEGLKREFDEKEDVRREDVPGLIAETRDKLTSRSELVADRAAIELQALELAKRYQETVGEIDLDDAWVRNELKNLDEEEAEVRDSLTGGTLKARLQAIKDTRQELEERKMRNKIDRAEAYTDMSIQLAGLIYESGERNKAWREQEKARVSNIRHMINSDLQGRSAAAHTKATTEQKIVNSGLLAGGMLSPLQTFDQMLKMMGNKAVDGEGYLWNHFMRGNIDARQKEIVGRNAKQKMLDEKVKELWGDDKMTWAHLIENYGNQKAGYITILDGNDLRSYDVRVGNLLYVYMVDKMEDGRMKLRKMGIDEATIGEIVRKLDSIDPRLREVADWLQEEFLPGIREDYNETHKRMFGAPMWPTTCARACRIASTSICIQACPLSTYTLSIPTSHSA